MATNDGERTGNQQMNSSIDKGEDQGNHECEIWTEGAEGSFQWENCQKNPGHENFIEAPDFCIENLPEPYREKNVFALIQLLSDLTVRLRVKYTSTARPDGYIFSRFRGQSIQHTGSGFVCNCDFYDYTNDKTDTEPMLSSMSQPNSQNLPTKVPACKKRGRQCPCSQCISSENPVKSWWSIWVRTAKHVLFDDEEAAATMIDFGFDESKTVPTNHLHGVRMTGGDIVDDWCEVECVTHDLELGKKLNSISDKFSALRRQLNNAQHDKCYPPLAVIVSHPHGFSKHISIGEWMERVVRKSLHESYGIESTDYTYDTSTCRGSSGAPVMILGQDTSSGWVYGPLWYHTHSGSITVGVGKSAVGYDRIALEK